MLQCILDHSNYTVYPINGLISLTGLFPNFVKDGKNIVSNKSKYSISFGFSTPFSNIYGFVYQTDINMKKEGFELVEDHNHITFAQYKNGILEGPTELRYKSGKLITKGQYKNGLREGIWKSVSVSGEIKETKYRNGRSEEFYYLE